MAIICTAVLSLAMAVTGTLTRGAGQEFAQARDQDFARQDDQRRHQPQQAEQRRW